MRFQEAIGVGLGDFNQFLGGALGDDLTAAMAALGAQVDDVVGGFDDIHLVLDDDHGVSGV